MGIDDPVGVEFDWVNLFDPFRVARGYRSWSVGVAHGYWIHPLRGWPV